MKRLSRIVIRTDRTRNQMRVAIQSGCVTKNLALQRWSKIDFPPEFHNCQMHSFPIMYNTVGSKWRFGRQRPFSPKKWPYNSVMRNMEHYLRNDLWARCQA